MKVQSPDKWKTVITWGAVSISGAVLGYFLFKIPNQIIMKYAAVFITVFIEVVMCFALGLAFAFWNRNKETDRVKAGALFIFWGLYVFIACLGAVALFMTELQVKNTEVQAIKDTESRNETGYNKAVADESYWQGLMEKEDQTDQGPKWRYYKSQKDKATEDREKYEAALNSSSETSQEVSNDVQSGFAEVFGGAWKALLTVVFGIIMLVVYVAQLIAAWEIPLDSNKPENKPVKSIPEPPKPPLTVPESEDDNIVQGINFSDKKQPFVDFVEELYSETSGEPPTLKPLSKIESVSARQVRKYKNLLNAAGAIVTDNGTASIGVWPKERVLEWVKNNG